VVEIVVVVVVVVVIMMMMMMSWSVGVMLFRDPEPQVIEFQTQQYKLFPLLATAYAYWFAGQMLQKAYNALEDELKKGITASLPEVG